MQSIPAAAGEQAQRRARVDRLLLRPKLWGQSMRPQRDRTVTRRPAAPGRQGTRQPKTSERVALRDQTIHQLGSPTAPVRHLANGIFPVKSADCGSGEALKVGWAPATSHHFRHRSRGPGIWMTPPGTTGRAGRQASLGVFTSSHLNRVVRG